MTLPPKTWVEISKDALLHNMEQFRHLVGEDVALMAVVKSNAYGHGLREVASILKEKTSWFGVDSLSEALSVREVVPHAQILILGVTLPEWMETAAQSGIRMTVASTVAVNAILQIEIPAIVHVKVETGTTRQGLSIDEFPDALKRLEKASHITIEGLSTHYANIEDTTDHVYAKTQLDRFLEFHKIAQELLDRDIAFSHTACSAATVLFPETYFHLARLGVSLYGYWSSKETYVSAHERGIQIDLKPALTWRTRIAQVKQVKAGTPISYGLTEKMPRDGTIAVLPIGYWDGYDRKLSSVGEVLVHGQRAKILGRVCMNMCLADVTGIGNVRSGDTVTIIGSEGGEVVSVESLAQKIGTISYEVVTRINPLIERRVV